MHGFLSAIQQFFKLILNLTVSTLPTIENIFRQYSLRLYISIVAVSMHHSLSPNSDQTCFRAVSLMRCILLETFVIDFSVYKKDYEKIGVALQSMSESFALDEREGGFNRVTSYTFRVKLYVLAVYNYH